MKECRNKLKNIAKDGETDKWEVQGNSPCYTKQRRKLDVCSSSSPLRSSQDSGLQSQAATGNQSSPSMVQKLKTGGAVSEQNSSTSSKSLSCVLPPI